MDEHLHTIFVTNLRACLELTRIAGAAFMRDLESPDLSAMQKRAVFRRWDEAMRQGEILESTLHLVREQEREKRNALGQR